MVLVIMAQEDALLAGDLTHIYIYACVKPIHTCIYIHIQKDALLPGDLTHTYILYVIYIHITYVCILIYTDREHG